MTYIRKTTDEYQVHANNGYGWEEITCADNRKEAQQLLNDYRTNQPECSFKLKKVRVKKLTYEQWIEKYKRVTNDIDTNASFDGCLFETYSKEVERVLEWANSDKKNHVWTVIEADGELFVVNGYHLVNRLGYFLTENANMEPNLECEVHID